MEQAKWDSSSLQDGWQIKDNKGNKQRRQAEEKPAAKYCLRFFREACAGWRRDPHSCCVTLMHNGIYIVHLSMEGPKRTFSLALLLQIGPCSQWKCN